MKKKKINKDIIQIDDDNFLDEQNKEEKKKDKIKEKPLNNKKVKEIEREETNNFILEDKKKTKKTKTEKSKINIFFLIITLLVIILYGVSIFLKLDFSNLVLEELIKLFAFPLISLLIIIILFKVNNKSITPLVILLSLVLIFYSIFNISYAKENDIYVSDFINKNVTSVIEWAEKYNIELVELHEFSDTIPKNHIILQEYGINTLVSEINSLTITISDGPNYEKEVVVSNLTGFTYDEVMKYISENHLNNVTIEFIDSDKEKDTVIEQIGSGTLKRSDKIEFIFSKGLETESIPVKDLKGLSLFEATSYLKRNSILYEIEYEYSNEIIKDFVISQDIVDKIVEDKLTLVVSRGCEIEVPNLNEMTTNEISKWAFQNNIKIKYLEEYNKEYELGKIINTSHTSGEKISEDTTVTITISKGSMTMPNVTNLSEFKIWANDNNIKFEEVYEFSTEYKNGEIIKTSPLANQKITENDTIVITISKGKSVKIPNLVGLSKSNIESKCKELNLSCTFTYGSYTESTKRDISLKQSKANGSVVSEGSNVLITLSSGIYEKVSVPSFTGKTKNQITSSCNSLGIKCNFKYNSNNSNETKDTAISQDKTGSIIKGSTVNITLSIGPAKTYTVVIDGSLLTLGNPEQTKKTLKSKLESACPGVTFKFSFKAVNSGIGYLNQNSQVKVGSNSFTQGKTYNVIINSSN